MFALSRGNEAEFLIDLEVFEFDAQPRATRGWFHSAWWRQRQLAPFVAGRGGQKS
jgi:hypothetical protein